jgi:hypothetical protein
MTDSAATIRRLVTREALAQEPRSAQQIDNKAKSLIRIMFLMEPCGFLMEPCGLCTKHIMS